MHADGYAALRHSGTVSRGGGRGLRRDQCKSCGKTFNAATGTPLAGLHRKEKWPAFGTCPADGETVCASAALCGLAVKTASLWRRRILAAGSKDPRKLAGIVDPDETYVLESRKGERRLDRKARRRGGKAGRRGLSSEQDPFLFSADCSGMTVSAAPLAANAGALRNVI